MTFRRFLTFGFVLLCLGACQQATSNQEPYSLSHHSQSPVYLLGANDVLSIRVFNESDLSGKFTVNQDGTVTLPLIGSVLVAGLSPQEAATEIKTQYADGYLVNPVVSVEIDSYRDFFIMGEVESPGNYEYQPDLTVMKAIALAGGFTYRANQKDFVLSETEKKKGLGYTISNNYKVSPGDVIIVKERLF